jgi:hypothetical protein
VRPLLTNLLDDAYAREEWLDVQDLAHLLNILAGHADEDLAHLSVTVGEPTEALP